MRMKLFPIVLVLAFAQSVLAKDPVVTIEYSKMYPRVFDITVEGENYTLRTRQSEYDWHAENGLTNRVLEVDGAKTPNGRISIIDAPLKGTKRELYHFAALYKDNVEVLELLVFGVMPYATPNGGGVNIRSWEGDQFAFLDSAGFGPDFAEKDMEVAISGAKAHSHVAKLLEWTSGTHYLTINGIKSCFYKTNTLGHGSAAYASFWMADFKNDKFVQASKKRFPNLTVIDKRIKKADLDDRKASEPNDSKTEASKLVAGAISTLAKVD